MLRQGFHIGFSGIDGSGKSTQAALLVNWMTQQGSQVVLREGKCDLVATVSSELARRAGAVSGREYLGQETFLLSQSFDVLRETMFDVLPYTAQGFIVVSARTPYCRLAAGLRRGLTNVAQAAEIMLFAGAPDLTIWLDVEAEVAAQRIKERGEDPPPTSQLSDYRQAFGDIFVSNPAVRIDANLDTPAVFTAVKAAVEQAVMVYS